MKAKPILAIFIVILLVAVAVPLVASADTTQCWYLTDTNTDPTPPTGATYNMYKEDTTKGSTGYLSIAGGSSRVWAADEVAQTNVTFTYATWEGEVILESTIGQDQLVTLTLGYIDGTGFHGITPIQNWRSDAIKTTISIYITPDSCFTVQSDQYLALKIDNASGNDDLKVRIQDQSHLASPGTDPGYPIPELPTIVLLATGLVGLAAYFGLKGRKRVYLKA